MMMSRGSSSVFQGATGTGMVMGFKEEDEEDLEHTEVNQMDLPRKSKALSTKSHA